MDLKWEKLLPALQHQPGPAGEVNETIFAEFLKKLSIPPPHGAANSPIAERTSGNTYSFEPNYETLHSLRIDFGKDSGTLTYRLLGGGERRGLRQLSFGYGCWQEGRAALASPNLRKVAASGVWTAEETFTLTLCQYETPFIVTITCRFSERQVFYQITVNVSFFPQEYPQLVGTAS
jgi:hypothetical protein